jgi:hydrogenase maturation factor HypF (carbamoyltransferase family)
LERQAGRDRALIAAAFHETIAPSTAKACAGAADDRRVPPNDGGISYGQASVAAAWTS